jgi:hypothetical protein
MSLHHSFTCEKTALEVHPRLRPTDAQRRNIKVWADMKCQMNVPLDHKGNVLAPNLPMDVYKGQRPQKFVPIHGLLVPWHYGETKPFFVETYPEITGWWFCRRWIANAGYEVDRFRPAASGGLYGWENEGCVCIACNRWKWQYWPFWDYRSAHFKAQVQTYLEKEYGKQLWLSEMNLGR